MISFIKKSWQKFSGLFSHNFAGVILRQYLRHIRQVIKYLRTNLRKKRKKFFFFRIPVVSQYLVSHIPWAQCYKTVMFVF